MTMRWLTAVLGGVLVVGGVVVIRSKLKADAAALEKDVADQIAKQKAANERAAADAANAQAAKDAAAKKKKLADLGILAAPTPADVPPVSGAMAALVGDLGRRGFASGVNSALMNPTAKPGPLDAIGVEDLPETPSIDRDAILRSKADYKYAQALMDGTATNEAGQALNPDLAVQEMRRIVEALRSDAADLGARRMRLAATQLSAQADKISVAAGFAA